RRGAGGGAGNLVGTAHGVVFRIARSHEIVARRISLGGGTAKLFRGAVHGGAGVSGVVPTGRFRRGGEGGVHAVKGKGVVFGGGQTGGVDFGADEFSLVYAAGQEFSQRAFRFRRAALSYFCNRIGRCCGGCFELASLARFPAIHGGEFSGGAG